jgi:hypothetical protein
MLVESGPHPWACLQSWVGSPGGQGLVGDSGFRDGVWVTSGISEPAIEVPSALVVSQAKFFGDAGRAWVAALPQLAAGPRQSNWSCEPHVDDETAFSGASVA